MQRTSCAYAFRCSTSVMDWALLDVVCTIMSTTTTTPRPPPPPCPICRHRNDGVISIANCLLFALRKYPAHLIIWKYYQKHSGEAFVQRTSCAYAFRCSTSVVDWVLLDAVCTIIIMFTDIWPCQPVHMFYKITCCYHPKYHYVITGMLYFPWLP